MQYETRITKKTIVPKDGKTIATYGFSVEITEDSMGEFEFVEVSMLSCPEVKICIEHGQWPQLKEVIEEMIKELR